MKSRLFFSAVGLGIFSALFSCGQAGQERTSEVKDLKPPQFYAKWTEVNSGDSGKSKVLLTSGAVFRAACSECRQYYPSGDCRAIVYKWDYDRQDWVNTANSPICQ